MRVVLLAMLVACGDNKAPPDALDLTNELTCCDTTYTEALRACAADHMPIANVCFDLPCASGDVRVCNVRGTTPGGCCIRADGQPASDGEVQTCAAAVLPHGECGPLECGVSYGVWRTVQVCGA